MEKSSIKGKGTVTPLDSMFSAEEALRAAKRVEDTISEKRKELDALKQFVADNSGVASLVSKLPDELSHPVMVPLGKAAFFPGQLVHTNEFMVLLGEGYFAERTGRQTVEILKRRGKVLVSQMEALKANLKDLEAEASYFGISASEAAEGLMEIREDYVEEESHRNWSRPDDLKVTVEDDEYAHMMSRLDQLEREEVAAGDESGTDESEEASLDGGSDESDEDEQTDEAPTDGESDLDEPDIGNFASQYHSLPQKQELKNSQSLAGDLSKEHHNPFNVTDQTNCTGLTVQPVNPDRISNAQISKLGETRSPAKERVFMLPKVKETFEEILSGKEAFRSSIMEHRSSISSNSQVQTATSVQAPAQTSKPRHDSSKAFTGSIVERTFNLPSATTSSQTSDPQPSKPVSRFKLQRT